MNKFEHIIPLGQTCNITFLMQNCNIKKETTLFEWFVTNNLNNITNILNKIGNNIDCNIIQSNGGIWLEDSDVYSGHYSKEEFIPIYKRRANRLLETIKDNNKILFIRFEVNNNNTYTTKDIDDFINSIKHINPYCDEMKLLLITPEEIVVKHPFVINKQCDYNIIHSDPYCSGQINELFIDMLKSVGYVDFNVSNITFNDKSLI